MEIALFFTQGVALTDWAAQGIVRREVAVYQTLMEFGVKVSVVTYGGREDLRLQAEMGGIQVLCNRWHLPMRIYQRLIPLLHWRHLAGTDLVKTNQFKGGDIALRSSRLLTKPLVARGGYIWSQFAERDGGRQTLEFRRARETEKALCTEATCVVVTTEQMREYLVEEYGVPPKKVRVIPNYVATDLFCPDARQREVPGRVLYVGRLAPQKNVRSLIEALNGLKVEFVVIGDGPERVSLQELAREIGLKAVFLGNVEHSDLPRHLCAAQVVVLPSLYEGHPKTLLEAMACGCAVIATDVVGVRELVTHRESGYVCAPTVSEIRSSVEVLLSDAALRDRLGKAAREFVAKRFALDVVARRERRLLEEVAVFGTRE